MNKNVSKQVFDVNIAQRSAMKNQQPLLVWFTGLSGSGKTTIANALEKELYNEGVHTYLLDGDNVRMGLNRDLTFSARDRTENIRRIAEVSNLMIQAGLVVITTFISPYQKDRQGVKQIVGAHRFVEVFISTTIEECEKRDIKGLYKKARVGEIKMFTGISAPYEEPTNANIVIDTLNVSIEQAVKMILKKIKNKIEY